jgi:hypothetical protein
MFDVSTATVYREIEAGKLAAFRCGTGSGALRITGEAINVYLAQERCQHTVVRGARVVAS